jgi:hypothetical protein
MNATAPLTAMTTRERFLAGLPPRDKDERATYVEYRLAARPVKERAVRRDR